MNDLQNLLNKINKQWYICFVWFFDNTSDLVGVNRLTRSGASFVLRSLLASSFDAWLTVVLSTTKFYGEPWVYTYYTYEKSFSNSIIWGGVAFVLIDASSVSLRWVSLCPFKVFDLSLENGEPGLVFYC